MMSNNKSKIILLFLFLSSLTIASHFFNSSIVGWIDIPTHFAGGMAVATLLPKKIFKKKPLFSLFAIATIGIGWEFVEIVMANKEIFTGLFQETKADKTIDLIAGLAGFVFMYGSGTDAGRTAVDTVSEKMLQN